MKTRSTLTALLCAAACLTLGACGPDEAEQPVPQPGQHSISLAGTSWMSDVENDYTFYYGNYPIQMLCNQLTIIDLNDDLNGEMFFDISIEVPSAPAANQSQTHTEAFTYTFDGSTLKLTGTGENSTEGDEDILTFNPADTTFSMPINDPEMTEMLGVNTLVFHLIQGTFNLNK